MPDKTKMDKEVFDFVMKLYDARVEKRLTQTALAKLIGSTKNTVWCWENGVRFPNMTNLRKLAKTLGVKFK